MELHLENRVAIVTGGASGIGRTTAEYLRRERVKLFLVDEQGRKLRGLPAGNIRFVLARLEPAVPNRPVVEAAVHGRRPRQNAPGPSGR